MRNMGTALDRYGEALGLWILPKEQEDEDNIELTLKMGDGKKLRDILMDDRNKKDKAFLFKRFEEFLYNLIKRDYPDVVDDSIKGYIEMNIMKLFDSAQVTFRFTTEEELKKAKQDMLKDLKKSIEDG